MNHWQSMKTGPTTDVRSPGGANTLGADLEALRRLSRDQRRDLLERCCGAAVWVERMLAEVEGPADDRRSLAQMANECFDVLDRTSWLEAFSRHPRIGDLEALRGRFGATAQLEQAGTRSASEDVLRALQAKNAEYESRFGYIFIVCAIRKSADEMLALLEERLVNPPGTELGIAAREQRRIAVLRLETYLRA